MEIILETVMEYVHISNSAAHYHPGGKIKCSSSVKLTNTGASSQRCHLGSPKYDRTQHAKREFNPTRLEHQVRNVQVGLVKANFVPSITVLCFVIET